MRRTNSWSSWSLPSSQRITVLCGARLQEPTGRIGVTTMNFNGNNFGKALESVISARTREATRQIGRNNEFLLIGAVTKRPN
jgi:hypothetical protein